MDMINYLNSFRCRRVAVEVVENCNIKFVHQLYRRQNNLSISNQKFKPFELFGIALMIGRKTWLKVF